jgi:hypothetical protein
MQRLREVGCVFGVVVAVVEHDTLARHSRYFVSSHGVCAAIESGLERYWGCANERGGGSDVEGISRIGSIRLHYDGIGLSIGPDVHVYLPPEIESNSCTRQDQFLLEVIALAEGVRVDRDVEQGDFDQFSCLVPCVSL